METSKTKPKVVVVNLSATKYEILKRVCKDKGWSWTADSKKGSDLIWKDTSVTADVVAKLGPNQKINHFPGMSALSRKNNLARNLSKLKKCYPGEYNFVPATWSLPLEANALKYHKPNGFYIVKPENSCQGRGIYIAKSFKDIREEKCIVQQYVQNPLLLSGLKFDLRIYVLLTKSNPLEIYIFKDGIARFATEMYEVPNSENAKNQYIHLTNYSINKNSSFFNQNEHKRRVNCVFRQLSNLGCDTEDLWKKIKDIAIKTLISAQPSIDQTYSTCSKGDNSFEILGFDILLDKDFKPWLLEVNHTPSFTVESDIDFFIKYNVISQALNIVGIKANDEDTEKYEKIFPNDADIYSYLLNRATTLWEKSTGVKRRKGNFVRQKPSPVPLSRFDSNSRFSRTFVAELKTPLPYLYPDKHESPCNAKINPKKLEHSIQDIILPNLVSRLTQSSPKRRKVPMNFIGQNKCWRYIKSFKHN